MPEHTKKFIIMLWKNERPWRAAAAPTTSPNAMMPGATGSPRRSPRLKPDHRDLSGTLSKEVMEVEAPVLAGLVPAIHVLSHCLKDVDARHIGVQSTPSFRTAVAGHDAKSVAWASALWLRGDLARRRLRPRTLLAGGWHGGGARRGRLDHRLAHRSPAVEQILDLVARQRFELEKALGEHFEISTLVGQDLRRFGIAGLDQLADLRVNRLGGCFRNILLTRDLVPEENLVLVFAVGNGAELVGQTPARHHHARELGGLLDVGSSAGGDLFPAEHHFLGDAPAHHDGEA